MAVYSNANAHKKVPMALFFHVSGGGSSTGTADATGIWHSMGYGVGSTLTIADRSKEDISVMPKADGVARVESFGGKFRVEFTMAEADENNLRLAVLAQGKNPNDYNATTTPMSGNMSISNVYGNLKVVVLPGNWNGDLDSVSNCECYEAVYATVDDSGYSRTGAPTNSGTRNDVPIAFDCTGTDDFNGDTYRFAKISGVDIAADSTDPFPTMFPVVT